MAIFNSYVKFKHKVPSGITKMWPSLCGLSGQGSVFDLHSNTSCDSQHLTLGHNGHDRTTATGHWPGPKCRSPPRSWTSTGLPIQIILYFEILEDLGGVCSKQRGWVGCRNLKEECWGRSFAQAGHCFLRILLPDIQASHHTDI